MRGVAGKCVALVRTALVAGFVLAALSGAAAANCTSPPPSSAPFLGPCVDSFSPLGGATNAGVTINGSRFKQFTVGGLQTFDVTVTSVKIAGVEANTFSVVSDTQISAIAGDPGATPLPFSGPIEVTTTVTSASTPFFDCGNPGECGPFTAQSAGNFTYETVMVLTASPAVVSGTSYSQDSVVSGGTGPYTFTKANGSLPPGTSLNTFPTNATVSGTLTSFGSYSYTIKVTDVYGQTASALVFGSTAPPTITSVTPATGPEAGGQSVVIKGSNLAGATSVTVGGKSVPFSVLSGAGCGNCALGSQISINTPSQASPGGGGAVSIVVTTPISPPRVGYLHLLAVSESYVD